MKCELLAWESLRSFTSMAITNYLKSTRSQSNEGVKVNSGPFDTKAKISAHCSLRLISASLRRRGNLTSITGVK